MTKGPAPAVLTAHYNASMSIAFELASGQQAQNDMSNIIQERLEQSVNAAKIKAEEGNLLMMQQTPTKPLQPEDFPLGVPLYDGHSRIYETLMPGNLELEMDSIFCYHKIIINRMKDLMNNIEDLSRIPELIATYCRNNVDCFYSQENTYLGQTLLRRLRGLHPTWNREKHLQQLMKYEEVQQAIETFKAKTDIKHKGMAMSELTLDEIDAGASSNYFKHYGNSLN